jgi:Family of unknown function (DUF6262)
MRADNTRHIVTAARQRTEKTRERAVRTLRQMNAAGQPVTLGSLARQARVSRSWLYTQDDLRGEIERLRDHRRPPPGPGAVPDRQRASTTSLLRRLEAAADRIRRLEEENQQLRDALARALGERREAEILGQAHSRDTPTRENPKIIVPCWASSR